MKRSQHITLGLLAGMALAFTSGCHRMPERRDCVDESGRIVTDNNCDLANAQRRNGSYSGPYFHYVWGGRTGGNIGDQVLDGNPMPGMGSAASSSSGGVSRGGFGSTGSSGGHGGSGGE